tara:strand:+ start:117 stop:497 length:381 start_codon:yes stop_codon:yes gene_type:complete
MHSPNDHEGAWNPLLVDLERIANMILGPHKWPSPLRPLTSKSSTERSNQAVEALQHRRECCDSPKTHEYVRFVLETPGKKEENQWWRYHPTEPWFELHLPLKEKDDYWVKVIMTRFGVTHEKMPIA